MLPDGQILLALFISSALLTAGTWLAPCERISHRVMILGAALSLGFPAGGFLFAFHIYTLGELGVVLWFGGIAGWGIFTIAFMGCRIVERQQEGRDRRKERKAQKGART